MASLRQQIARGMEESRRQDAARRPREGYFSPLESESQITFTTRGRRSGVLREKWWLPFAPDGDVLYLLEENGSDTDWVRNLMTDSAVVVEGAPAVARVVGDEVEIERARELCRARFARRGLLVADLVERGLVIAFEHAAE